MSKFVKNLITRDIKNRLGEAQDAILINVIGMTSDTTYALRKHLRSQNIELLAVKRSLARMATTGTSLAPAFEGLDGSVAIVWGSEDFVSLAKEITTMVTKEQFPKLELRGGVMDGEALTADQVKAISKWPSRTEQISMLVGQILSPGSTLAGQLIGPGGMLASQVEKIADAEATSDAPAEGGAETAPEAGAEEAQA